MNGRVISCLIFLRLLQIISAERDTIATNRYIRDGETIVSTGEMFELGFFSPGNSKHRYLGIWYYNRSPQTVVWVANREIPITNTSGLFKVSSEGILQVHKDEETVIWSTNSSLSIGNIIPVAQILDNGNLIVRNESDIDRLNLIWQSFDHPCDHSLPGMKFGKDFVTGKNTIMTSWKSLDDPASGLYANWMDTDGYPQTFISRSSVIQYRFGPWNGLRLSGFPSKIPNPIYTFEFVLNQKEVYFKWELINTSFRSRIYLSPQGSQGRLNWIDPIQGWVQYLAITVDMCAQYGQCGPYGICDINKSPICSCIDGFEPLHPEEWNIGNWSSGCQRKKPLDCGKGDGFQKVAGLKLPDSRQTRYNVSMSLAECKIACKRSCNCTAYANLDVRNGGSGCLLWFRSLMDTRQSEENQDLYIRIAMTESTGSSKKRTIILVLSTSVGVVLIGLPFAVYAYKKKPSQRSGNAINHSAGILMQSLGEDYTDTSQNKDADLPSFSLAKIEKYTNHFSVRNKLGEGGFGPVYKGVMEDGREIAVKRLSETSTQGLDEFKNEVKFVARLQHRNLVKLLGYCTQGNEILLIYEYMPNRSLDTFIFDKARNLMLDWTRRFHIIQGIARGLLYLHQDSRLRIIHRDLKASNILLDNDMNPKISDFGLARRFKGFETGAKTECGWNLVRINKLDLYFGLGSIYSVSNSFIKSYCSGYISPEYAVHGFFSVKSDVFSFGVLVLEIVSGMKNRGFFDQEYSDNLLGRAWRLYKDDKTLELLSEPIRKSCDDTEVLRCVHIGLLCVQNHVDDRPTMSSVVQMFGNEGMLPPPKQPAFFSQHESSSSSSAPGSVSVSEVTITLLKAR